MSGCLSDAILRQDLQLPQGSVMMGRLIFEPPAGEMNCRPEPVSASFSAQLRAIAKTTAARFLPTPSIPVNRRAWGMVPF